MRRVELEIDAKLQERSSRVIPWRGENWLETVDQLASGSRKAYLKNILRMDMMHGG